MEKELKKVPKIVFLSSGGILGDLVLGKIEQSRKAQIVGVVRSRRMMLRDAGFLRGTLIFFRRCGIAYSLYMWLITTLAEYLGWIIGKGSITARAKKSGIPTLQTKDINNTKGKDFIKNLKPDLVVVAHFDQKIHPALCEDSGCPYVNIHPSPLPHYRGIDPVLHCMKNRDHQYGVTVHHIVEEIDAGPILAMKRIVPNSADSVFSITYDLMRLGGDLLISLLENNISFDGRNVQVDSGNYETWPTPLDIKQLRLGGGKIINKLIF
jgi:methionyl-tRNA formyltransferase